MPTGLFDDLVEQPASKTGLFDDLVSIPNEKGYERNPDTSAVPLHERVLRSEAAGHVLHSLSRLRPDIMFRDALVMLGQPQRILGYSGGVEASSPIDQSLVSSETVKNAMEMMVPRGSTPNPATEGLQDFVSQVVSGMSTVPNVAGLVGGKISPAIPAIEFIPPMVQDLPQAIQDVGTSQTPQERTANLLRVMLNIVGPLGMAGAFGEKVSSPSGLKYSDIPGAKMEDLPGGQEVAPASRQLGYSATPFPGPRERGLMLPENTYNPASEVSPVGGATMITKPSGETIPVNALSPLELREAVRGPAGYTPREQYVRPAQQGPVILGQQPAQARPVYYTGLFQDLVEPVVPSKAPVEPGGGEISFRSEANAEGIPNALQQAKEQNASTIRSSEEQAPQGGYGQEKRGEARGNDIQQLRQEEQPAQPSGVSQEARGEVKPEVVKMGGSKIKGPLGDPLGTTYRATPEDYAAYQKAQADLKQLTVDDPHMEKPDSMARYQEIVGRNETIKNKYGGMPPEAPLSGSIPSQAKGMQTRIKPGQGSEGGSIVNPIAALIDKFKNREKELRGDTFALSGPRIAIDPKESGFPNPQKEVDAQQLWNRVKNKLTPAERDVYEKSGIDKAIVGKGKITPEEAGRLMQEGGPQVKVESYGMEGKVSEFKAELDVMTHNWYDTLDNRRKNAINFVKGRAELGASDPFDGLPHSVKSELTGIDQEKLKRYIELSGVTSKERAVGPRATSAYSQVSALPTNEPMPEWTKSKGGKNVQRVDVVIPKNTEEQIAQIAEKNLRPRSRDEGILWQPDNLHENLPNTLGWAMIQYKTGAKGEKIAVVAEAQSRWGQSVREAKQKSGNLKEVNGEGTGSWSWVDSDGVPRGRQYATREEAARNIPNDIAKQDHPLLRDYNRLILKAAIDQARKEGATHIVVSDAETAMMTEGHDTHLVAGEDSFPYNTREDALQAVDEGSTQTVEKQGDAWYVIDRKISQEPGMRLNYDTILPKIAEELTGSKGEKVSLGEHKNAFTEKTSIGGGLAERRPWDNAESAVKQQRDNLIFRNPDGTSKTDVSGVMYPLPKAEQKFSLFEKDRPESVAGRLYMNPVGPIVTQAIRDVSELGSSIAKLVRANATKERISQLLDAADNQARVGAQQIGNRIRQALSGALDRKALTFVIEAGGDRTKLQEFLSKSSNDPKAQQAIRFAISNYDRLEPHAKAASKLMEEQRQLEIDNKVNTDEAPNYIKHSYESRNQDFFDPKGSGVSTSFKKQRTFATYAEAIEAGYVPKNLDAADLVESRIAAGRKMVNRTKWGEALHDLTDPTDKKPLTESMLTQPKGTQVAPSGYQPREILPGMRVAVKDGYTGIFDALTGRSDLANSVVTRVALQTEGALKHGLLLFDTFHASRVAQKQVFLTGQVGYKKGLSLLEYDEPTINRMVKNGDINEATAKYAKENRPNAQLLLKNGLNVGRIAEALYSDVIRKELKVMGIDINVPGRFNRWVFDKMTRGAMMQSALIELERTQKNHPEWTPEQAAGYAAKQINVYFGNLGRQGLFKSATKQDALRLAFLAPQWVESMVQTEARAAKQAAQVPIDLATEGKFRVGPAAKGVGIGLLAYVIGTQLLNKYTTGHFTWDNEDKDHKMDAWIPDKLEGSGGYWVSPLSVAAEVTHDVIRYTHSKGSKTEAVAQIIGNKLSPLARAEETIRTGRDYAGNKILETGERYKQAGKALIPLPLPLSALKSDQPGQWQRQFYGSVGLKTEIASGKKNEQDQLAQEKFGKDFKDLGVGQRVQLQKSLPVENKSLQERYTIAQHSTDKEFQRLNETEKALSPEVQSWLKKNKQQISDYRNFKQIAGSQVKLTSTEQEKLDQLMVAEYDKALARVMNNSSVNEKNISRYVSVNLENARARAWALMLKEIQASGRSGGDTKK